MSEEEERFLARWSRRKLEAPEAAPDSGAPNAPAPGADAAAQPKEGETDLRETESAAPQVDLSKLPSLESITAATDIRAFLTAGVPEQLKLAALRRTWTADPAIRDFKGLAENAWDFTAAESVPGFGPMLPTDDITRMVAQLTGRGEDADAATKADSDKTAADSARELGATVSESPKEPLAMQAQSGGHARSADAQAGFPQDLNKNSETTDISVKNEPEPDQDSAGRNHGGAVPR